jgi:hypothetical protein
MHMCSSHHSEKFAWQAGIVVVCALGSEVQPITVPATFRLERHDEVASRGDRLPCCATLHATWAAWRATRPLFFQLPGEVEAYPC